MPDKDEDKDDEESEEDNDDDELDEMPESFKKPDGQMKVGRASVSAEAFGAWNKPKPFEPVIVPKSDVQKERLKETLLKSFMFSQLDTNDMDIVVGAMKEVQCEAGVRLITQGEDGDFLFVIEDGTLECKIKVQSTGEEKVVKTVEPGDAFGELALLYNCPRAANVDSTSKCVLWQLDRATFNHIVRDAAVKRRERYEAFLQSVPLLNQMDAYERSQISDALKTEKYDKDTYILNQGEPGNTFYILEEGNAIATKSVDGGDAEMVMEYKPGDFFGERALLTDEPRAANVIASTPLRVLTLDRRSFKKMLGPLEEQIRSCTPCLV